MGLDTLLPCVKQLLPTAILSAARRFTAGLATRQTRDEPNDRHKHRGRRLGHSSKAPPDVFQCSRIKLSQQFSRADLQAGNHQSFLWYRGTVDDAGLARQPVGPVGGQWYWIITIWRFRVCAQKGIVQNKASVN